ncbi:MAG: hypothetical protein PHT69_17225, partial [Bacteroidales bacterium]|nr:hypothetical protein [Bacteroidales bacterium]
MNKNKFLIITSCLVLVFSYTSIQAQKVIVGESKPIEFLMVPKNDIDLPPDLYAHLAFIDESGNGILEADENAELQITIYNCGEGRAQDISILLEPQTRGTGLDIEKTSHIIPALFPNGLTTIVFPFKASASVQSMEHKMNIKITEKNGHNFEVIKFTYNTIVAAPPKVELVGLEVIDFGEHAITVDADGRLQHGEKVNLKIFVQNTGKGVVKDLQYEVYSKNKAITVTEGTGNLGNFSYGDVINFIVSVRVARNYSGEGKLPLYLTINTGNRVGGFTMLQLPLEIERASIGVNPNNIGRDLDNYISKYAVFEFSSHRINARMGRYFPPLFTSNIKNATTRASSGGYIVPSDLRVIARGVCWAVSTNPTLDNNFTVDGSGFGPYTSQLTGLQPSTTYYARAYTTYPEGTVFGNQISFTTLELPVLTTTTISNITATNAMSGGNITSDGGSPIIERGVCWSLAANPTVTQNKMTSGTGTGSFTTRITMLNANTTYYIRAYAISSAGVAYGDQMTFRTNRACDGIDYFVHEGQNY